MGGFVVNAMVGLAGGEAARVVAGATMFDLTTVVVVVERVSVFSSWLVVSVVVRADSVVVAMVLWMDDEGVV